MQGFTSIDPYGTEPYNPAGTAANHTLVSRMLKKVAGWLERSPCSRNARPQKDEKGAARCPSCSQSPPDEAVVARCAQ